MNPTPAPLFDALRPRLQRIAYRMLGSVAEAEDLVQDAWLRWQAADGDAIDNHEAWLVTVTTRLAIDRLRAVKAERTQYVGTWLPEPLLTDTAPSAQDQLERADELSYAFLALLERLTPDARAAFLLREVFDTDYPELARTLGKSEAACRQLVHRARTQLRADKPRFEVAPQDHMRLLQGFADAAVRGDMASLTALLANDAELIGDGGGKVPSFGKPLVGGRRIAQLYYAVWRRQPRLRMEIVQLNGAPGVLRFIDDVLESAQTFEIDEGRIVRVHSQRNPDKLAALSATWAARG